MSALLDYLNQHGPDGITAALGIKVATHPAFPSLRQFTYDQINSPKDHPVVVEARGAICEPVGGRWRYVARPFSRFFNVGEPGVAIASHEIGACSVAEKLDGSLIIAYAYADGWHFATRGRPAADGECSSAFGADGRPWVGTFARLADMASPGLRTVLMLVPEVDRLTLLFELTAPENRVVIPYTTRRMTLLAARDTVTGEYIDRSRVVSLAERLLVPAVAEHPAADFDALRARVNAARAIDSEGVVLVSPCGQKRAKLKNDAYVSLHHAVGSGDSTRAIVEMVRNNEGDEVIAHFPHIREARDRVAVEWARWVAEASHAAHEVARDAGERPPVGGRGDAVFGAWMKGAAALVQHRRGGWAPSVDSYVFTALRAAEDASADAWLRGQTTDAIIRALGLKASAEKGDTE